MPTEKKPKVIQFKQAAVTGSQQSLQTLLEHEFSTHRKPAEMVEWIPPHQSEGQVLLHPRHREKMLIFTMSTFEKGRLQPVLGHGDDLDKWTINQASPPRVAGAAESDFLDGYLFAGVLGNLVVLSATKACGPRDLELHLAWLLSRSEREGGEQKAVTVALNDSTPTSIRKKALRNVHALSLQRPLGTEVASREIEGKPDTKEVVMRPKGKVWTAVQSFVSAMGGKLDDEDLSYAGEDLDEIQVKLTITCPRRKIDTAGPIVDAMANAFRHTDDEHVMIELQDGSKLKGSDLKTRMQVQMDCSGGMPIPSAMDQALRDYLRKLIDEGRVEVTG